MNGNKRNSLQIKDEKEKTNLLVKIETLEIQIEEYVKKNKDLNNELVRSQNHLKSILEDNQKLEELIYTIDDSKIDMENNREDIKTELNNEFEKQITNLKIKINEIEHRNLNIELESKAKSKEIERLMEINAELQRKEKIYNENYIPKQKYESLYLELSHFKTENTNLDSRIMFRDIRVKDLEKNIASKEEKFKSQMEEIRKKLQTKLEKERKSAKEEIAKLVSKHEKAKNVNNIDDSMVKLGFENM